MRTGSAGFTPRCSVFELKSGDVGFVGEKVKRAEVFS
jgi:hypothetical protein